MQNLQRAHFLSVLTDRVHWPSAIVRVTPFYWMCGRVVYLCFGFLHHIHAANVCEKFVNCERIFLYEPCVTCPGVSVWHWRRVYWLVCVLLCLYDMAWCMCVDLCRTVAEWVNPGQYSLVVVTSSEGRSLPYGKLEDILSRETAALNCHTNDDKYVDLGNV